MTVVLPEMISDPVDKLLAEASAVGFLQKMHALSHPDQHVAVLEVAGSPIVDILPTRFNSPGAVMLNPEISVREKATMLHSDFAPVGRQIGRIESDRMRRISMFGEFLVSTAAQPERQLWKDRHGNLVPPELLLPPNYVVDSLYEWSSSHWPKKQVIKYVGQLLART